MVFDCPRRASVSANAGGFRTGADAGARDAGGKTHGAGARGLARGVRRRVAILLFMVFSAVAASICFAVW